MQFKPLYCIRNIALAHAKKPTNNLCTRINTCQRIVCAVYSYTYLV